ncbi:MAG: hypothetical protein IRZ05_01655 [Micromonosporaceae bacterium]|nr:hypothetical protein [Micromonosporaceae bacterium]
MERLTVSLYQPLTGSARAQLLSEWQFGVREVSAELTTAIDAGYDTATIRAPAVFGGMPLYTLLQGRADIEPFAHVDVRLGEAIVWQGLVTTYLMDRLALAGLGCVGYGRGLRHQAWSGGAGTALTVLQSLIRDTAPFVDLGPDSLVVDPGFDLTSEQTKSLTLPDLVRAINENGSLQGYPVACQVWDGPNGPQVVIVPRIPPTEPDIVIPPDDPGLTINDVELDSLINRVQVSNGTTTITHPANDAEIDMGALSIVRTETVTLDSKATASQMESYARAHLAAYSRLRVSGSWRTTERLPTPSGARVPPASVRAGAWALVPGVGVLQIVRTTYTYPAGEWSCEFGALSPNEQMARQIQGLAISSYRYLNPLTWLRS